MRPLPNLTGPHQSVLPAIQRRSWEWLLTVHTRFNVDVQIVDEHLAPALPDAGHSSSGLRELLATRAPDVQQAVRAAVATGLPHPVMAGALQCVCFRLLAGAAVGALVLAHRASGSARRDEANREELEALGGWLGMAIEAHISAPPEGRDLLHRLSTLNRLLADVAQTGTDRLVITRFADVMAVWHELDIGGYIDAGAGMYERVASLPGTELAAAIPASTVVGLQPLRVSSGENVRAASDDAEYVLVLIPSATEERSWLIAVLGAVAMAERAALQLSMELLASWLSYASTCAEARLLRAMWEALHPEGEQSAAARAAGALDAVHRELGGAAVSMAVRAITGASVLSATAPPGIELDDAATGVHRQSASGYVVTVSAMPPMGRMSPHEIRLVETAADVFCTWMEGRPQGLAITGDRRAARRRFANILEQRATELLSSGSPVAALVIAVEQHAALMHDQVRRLRAFLRPTDMVGLTDSGEIGVLLAGTRREGAEVVAKRLPSVLQPADAGADVPEVRVGISTRSPGEPLTAFLQHAVEQARSGRG